MLTDPLLGFILCKIFPKKEEAYLEETFGTPYLEYNKKVPAFIPIGLLLKD
jgi:protein-S-isoprenylcysteine O-methyltransferase Ste14